MEMKDIIRKKLENEVGKYDKKEIKVANQGDNDFYGVQPLVNQNELIYYNERHDILPQSKFDNEYVVNSIDLSDYLKVDVNDVNNYIKSNCHVVVANEYKLYESRIDKDAPFTSLSKSWEKWIYNVDAANPDFNHDVLFISAKDSNKVISYFRRNNESEVC